ncbi:hypothetical protein OS493_038653, partial [Desmophyllum pertusum]
FQYWVNNFDKGSGVGCHTMSPLLLKQQLFMRRRRRPGSRTLTRDQGDQPNGTGRCAG